MWLVAWALPELHFFLPAKTIFVAGLALVGAVIAAAGIVSFRVAKTTVNPMKPERASSLIVSGPYKYTRNPMYVGMVFALLGWAAFLSNFAALAGIPLFILYLNRFQIEPEERVLDKLFPHEFPRYRAKVRRWL
ncbi:MAG: isoprenylcysteine carboxylmethyltransferase family protein [Bryobacterales bacterium]|nr:isoprenylcysteine carboxylmethyltransferase family protein [Bryobacterales bacterium]